MRWKNRVNRINAAAIAARSMDSLVESPVGSRTRGFELDLRLREFEINQVTQRNNFFMIFQGVMIAGLVQSQGTAAPVITFAMAALGMTTSVLQIGMAGGAKYWQSRWESATRSSEIAIVLELMKANKLAVQTFTLDQTPLSEDERRTIAEWNAANPNDKIEDEGNFIRDRVLADVKGSGKRRLRYWLDAWVRALAIAPKWSVSRIPIWIGAILLAFWTTIWMFTWQVPGAQTSRKEWLVPLQAGQLSAGERELVRMTQVVESLERLAKENSSRVSDLAESLAASRRREDDFRRELNQQRESNNRPQKQSRLRNAE